MTHNENEIDRVRRSTAPEDLKRIDDQIEQNIRAYAAGSRERLYQRIRELQQEWSMERYLETNASVIGLTSALLGLTVSKKWFLLTTIVSGFLLQHAIQGWCPPVPVFRKRGVRTRGEIDREMFALKALRGDFREVEPAEENGAASEAARAAIV
jgi:hypothetical protein